VPREQLDNFSHRLTLYFECLRIALKTDLPFECVKVGNSRPQHPKVATFEQTHTFNSV
jgi:hypothetical protein